MKSLLYIVLYILVQSSADSDEPFKRASVTVKTHENETVVLPCYLNDTESTLRVIWFKNGKIVGDSHDPDKIYLPRVRMHTNNSLHVEDLQPEDTAEYTCEITRPEPWGPVRQTHSIVVQIAPTVKTLPEDGYLEVSKGEHVLIGCDTSGSPAPIVDWKKNGKPMALLEHRSRIKFRASSRRQAGVYECVANNSVGEPAKGSINVVIRDAPEVSSDRLSVHSAIGHGAYLAAKLDFAVPPARTTWYRDGTPVKTDERVQYKVHDQTHKLDFREVRKEDFGNYTFRAENKLGMTDLMFTLTGTPKVATFKVDVALNKATDTTFTLSWNVDSDSTIIEYNLWVRPYLGSATADPDASTTTGNHWSEIMVPGDSSHGPSHTQSYRVTGLTPLTVYEAMVTSRNSFGWSKPSSVLHFATEPAGPTTTTTTDISFNLEEYDETEPPPTTSTSPAPLEETTKPRKKTKKVKKSSGARETPCLAAILILCLVVFHSS